MSSVSELRQQHSYVALDPGETTGWAVFRNDGKPLGMGQFKQSEQTRVLTELLHSDVKACIVEDYVNYGHKQQKRWSRNQTSKNIGAIELLCELRSVPLVLQGASVKHIGYKWSGLDGPPSNHSISHQFDAYVHGVYWLQQNMVVPVGYFLRASNDQTEELREAPGDSS